MKKILMLAVVALFVAGYSMTAKAAILPALSGSDTLVTALNGGVSTPFAGLLAGSPVFTGTLDETVYSDPTGLLFEYQVSNTTSSPLTSDSIDILTTFDYAGFAPVEGNFGSGIAPTFSYNGGNGDVNFVFTSGIAPGSSSDVLYVQTDAKNFTTGYSLVQDHGQAQLVTDGPSGIGGKGTPTPEPATFSLLGMGFMGLMGLRRKVS